MLVIYKDCAIKLLSYKVNTLEIDFQIYINISFIKIILNVYDSCWMKLLNIKMKMERFLSRIKLLRIVYIYLLRTYKIILPV